MRRDGSTDIPTSGRFWTTVPTDRTESARTRQARVDCARTRTLSCNSIAFRILTSRSLGEENIMKFQSIIGFRNLCGCYRRINRVPYDRVRRRRDYPIAGPVPERGRNAAALPHGIVVESVKSKRQAGLAVSGRCGNNNVRRCITRTRTRAVHECRSGDASGTVVAVFESLGAA